MAFGLRFLWIREASNINASSVRSRLIAAIAVIVGVTVLASRVTLANPDSWSTPHIKAIFELYLRRPLTNAELERVLAENQPRFAKFDFDTAAEFSQWTNTMRKQAGSPVDFHVRNLLITRFYFEYPDEFGTKLLLSVDPVVVANTKLKQVMTRADVLAFVQLLKFHNTGHDPREIERARSDKDNELATKLTAELNIVAKKGSALPEMLLHTSAMWTGLVQHWASLTDEQKKSVRFYIATSLKGTLVDMPDELYAKLMGWSADEITMETLRRKYKVIMMMQGLQNRMLGMQQLYNAWYYGLRE